VKVRRLVALGVGTLAVALGPRPAAACAVCGAGDPTLTVMGTEKPFVGRLRLAADVKIGSLQVGTPGVDEVDLTEERFELAVAYAPRPTLFLSLALPVLHRDAFFRDGARVAFTGLGDVELRVKQFVWSGARGPYRHQAAIQGGLKLPTARVEGDAAGAALAAALQPGTGAITPFLGVFYGLSQGPWSLYASASLYLPFAVRAGPHATESFRTSASAQRQVGRRFAARLGIDTRLDGTAAADDKPDPNSGGFVGYLSPQLVVSPATDLILLVGAHFPLVQALQGFHREGAILSLGATYDF
jgi:hypothetical protein